MPVKFRQMDVEKVDKMHMRATRMVQLSNNYSYEDRLRLLNLPSVKCRCLRGYVIQVCNNISGVLDSNSTIQLNLSNIYNTAGNQFKM